MTMEEVVAQRANEWREGEGGRGGRVKGMIRMTTHQLLILSA